MARVMIKQQPVTFYEEHAELWKLIQEAAKDNEQKISPYIISILKKELMSADSKPVVTKTSEEPDELKGW